ncbi:MAG: hypothetical protein D6808_01345 [Candidatus Dadabacteria bacterium]|nr:MAG: hypothetical protein D6808_01345 [Candidatus Dadabacteria bacterium]
MNKAKRPSNWLGSAFKNTKRGKGNFILDSDSDGYTDQFELKHNSDPNDPDSVPNLKRTTSLINRLQGIDDDGDGIPNSVEREIGTSVFYADTDKDGVKDGAEKLSGTDPLDPSDYPIQDRDKDGLSDGYEISEGTDPDNPDTDGDLLRDDLEIAIGSDPFNKDTDEDGILDGREVMLGSDPVKQDTKKNRDFSEK